MTCLAAVLACLLSPSNVYVSGMLYAPVTSAVGEGAWCRNHWCRGPQGEARIGLRADLTRSLELDAGLMHRSFIREDDRGVESVYLTLTWRPFR